ncbi:MAG: c-type cytochrome biogenesis protein CcsB [Bacillota bacterium]
MFEAAIVLLWITVGVYAASSVAFAFNMAFHKEKAFIPASWLAVVGLVTHTVAIGLRWVEAGHGPYMRIYEVYSSDVWILVVMYLLVQWWRPVLRAAGVIVMPVCFLFIGMAVMASPEIRELPVTFTTYWLIVHILFAKLAYGGALIGTALAVLYLLKKRKTETDRLTTFYQRLPSLGMLDELSYAFIGFGFIMLGIMIVAGSIWANNAWGRYWGWDAVETWSLVSWLFYGIYLHLRFTYKWQGSKAAWFSVIAMGVLLFALFGIGLVYNSFHSPYITG